ncbi:MAG: GTPase Era [Christensenellaceae bacterium]|nr:GTPase Era [Christensenellaceae bacterium]
MEYKSGFVAIMGSPNVGKSTLMNRLIGMKIAIVSDKAQTTRNKVVGVLTTDDYQIIFLDTPGLHTPKTKLGKYMVDTAYSAQRDVDTTLMVIDAVVGIKERDAMTVERLNNPYFIAAINKIDKVTDERRSELRSKLIELGVAENMIVEISALNGDGVEKLEKLLVDSLEEGPQYYPPDMVTDRPERFIAAELIREKMLLNLDDEIPHGAGIEIEKVEELENLTKVSAVIYCERDSHKRIIIGARGSMLKKIGMEARMDMQLLFGTKVFLELWVKVKKDWRNSGHMLKELGYSKER